MHGVYSNRDLVGVSQLTVPSSIFFTSNVSSQASIPTVESIFHSVNILSAMNSSETDSTPIELDPFSIKHFASDLMCSKPVLDACVKSYFQAKFRKVTIPRIKRDRSENLWNSNWGQQLLHANFKVPGSWEWKRFRNRFRMPPDAFNSFVNECRVNRIFGEAKRDSRIAIEFKVMACLRILARDAVGDDIDEHLNIGNSTVNSFFKLFLANCVEKLYSKYVYVPQGSELDAVEAVYRKMGFPGCVGSMDCTHVFWDKCPNELRHKCFGKEKSPTLAFQVVVDHARRIHHVSDPFYGATNDITITYNDTYPMQLLKCLTHQDRTFQTYNRLGLITLWCGAYLLVDGGYPKCFSLVDPSLQDFTHSSMMWSEWLESLRKDVECCFGVLKQRFRFIKNANRFHDLHTISNAFKILIGKLKTLMESIWRKKYNKKFHL
mmetsp:Transcript_31718/g.43515  ORF Transcript_31718/g.43515 Transcript_31718/m.43515 type:complete len:434 (-) Transcript_31718:776-2077(-)